MKTLNEINHTLDLFKDKYGFRPNSQGSDEWHRARLGVLSASNAAKIVSGKTTEVRLTYMSELVGQVLTGTYEEINSKYLEHGKTHEASARALYEFETDLKIVEVPFVFKDETFREGCSPDFIIEGVKSGEIKCPFNPANYVKFFCEDKIKKEYAWQGQFQIRTLGCDTFDMCQFHPDFKTKSLKRFEIEKDEEMQKTLADAVPQFIHDMDKMLVKFVVEFGSQWGEK